VGGVLKVPALSSKRGYRVTLRVDEGGSIQNCCKYSKWLIRSGVGTLLFLIVLLSCRKFLSYVDVAISTRSSHSAIVNAATDM